ncbi:hypothetical protein G7059_01705 [Erysipelothrix sp. HDW6A]|uniref:hypothetical protein n=1 Tax=Erysipelothrix sp. HDW6A TaxID=2714928 RepID=UPI001408D849|nr:hypothetical protein [Erysipelothrix sp. HDW6A]QIK56649.1 hypothetical protein G7059_01705 [Erysipelothrix sp. HDW6A]
MSKADECLKNMSEILNHIVNGEIFEPIDRDAHIVMLSDVENYINRKDKLVAGSEWVCDVECYATNGIKTYRIGKNKVLAITFFEEDKYNVYFDFYDDVLDVSYLKNTNIFKFDEVKTSCVMPTEQFLACFSPKENL